MWFCHICMSVIFPGILPLSDLMFCSLVLLTFESLYFSLTCWGEVKEMKINLCLWPFDRHRCQCDVQMKSILKLLQKIHDHMLIGVWHDMVEMYAVILDQGFTWLLHVLVKKILFRLQLVFNGKKQYYGVFWLKPLCWLISHVKSCCR